MHRLLRSTWKGLRASRAGRLLQGPADADDPWAALKKADAFRDVERRYPAPHRPLAGSGVKLGILVDFWGMHRNYVAACEELGVDYLCIGLAREDWLERVRQSACDGFIVHPTAPHSRWKAFFDERLRVIADDLGRPLRPLLRELWFYESKRRMAYWMQAHDVPHPATHVFYEREEALAFCRDSRYPLVLKSDMGSSAQGVSIIRGPDEAEWLVLKAFGRGIPRRGGDDRDRDWGYVMFQEYLEDAREFRVIQIGESWFAHEKIRAGRGDFHSGSGQVAWNVPPPATLDLCHDIARKGRFQTMDYDVFVLPDGSTRVNELQAVFASYNPSQMYVDGMPGRYRRRDGQWDFEEGLFNRNGCANLRIEAFVKDLTRGEGASSGRGEQA